MNTAGFVRWVRGRNPFVLDGLLAAFPATTDIVTMMTTPQSPGPGTQGPSIIGAVLLLAENVSLLWRRKHPLLVLTILVVTFMTYQAAGFPYGAQFALLIAIYGVGAYCSQRTGRRAAGPPDRNSPAHRLEVPVPILVAFECRMRARLQPKPGS